MSDVAARPAPGGFEFVTHLGSAALLGEDAGVALVVAFSAMDPALAQRSVETHTSLSKDTMGCNVPGVCYRPHHRDVVARERPTDGCLRDFGRQALPPPCSSDPLSERRGSRIVKGQVRRADDAAVEHDGQLRLSGPVGLDGKGHEGFGVLLCRGEGHGRYVATEVLVVLVGLYIVNVAPSKGRRTSRSVTRESGRVRVRLRPDPPGGPAPAAPADPPPRLARLACWNSRALAQRRCQ
jgi:hypothetical protein